MLDRTEGYTAPDGRQIGGVLMELKDITLRFGGVVAIKEISFDIREGEIRAIIGQQCPDVEYTLIDGTQSSLSKLIANGKPTVLDFYTSW